MVRPPKLDSLRMFDIAARRLNFRLAAEELNLTQSAVAQRVRQLEEELGVVLFVRKPRGLALTSAGKRYHATISEALSMIDEATRGLSGRGKQITISVPPSFAAKWLVPLLSDFRKTYSHLDLQIEASERLADFLTDGIDFAIRLGAPPFGEGLHWELLSKLDLCAACSPAYKAEHGGETDLEKLSGHTLIVDSHDHWKRLSTHLPDQTKSPHLRVSHTSLAIDAARASQGIVLTPRIFISKEIREGELLEIRQYADDSQGFFLVFPKARLEEAKEALIPWLKDNI